MPYQLSHHLHRTTSMVRLACYTPNVSHDCKPHRRLRKSKDSLLSLGNSPYWKREALSATTASATESLTWYVSSLVRTQTAEASPATLSSTVISPGSSSSTVQIPRDLANHKPSRHMRMPCQYFTHNNLQYIMATPAAQPATFLKRSPSRPHHLLRLSTLTSRLLVCSILRLVRPNLPIFFALPHTFSALALPVSV